MEADDIVLIRLLYSGHWRVLDNTDLILDRLWFDVGIVKSGGYDLFHLLLRKN